MNGISQRALTQRRARRANLAIAVIIEIDGATTDLYEAVNREMGVGEWTVDDIPGMIFHSIGQTETGLVGVEAWESQEQFEAHVVGTIMPIIKKVGADFEPRVRIIPLHHIAR